MKSTDIIKDILEKSGVSKAELGRRLGIDSVGKNGAENKSKPTDIIAKRLNQKSITVEMMADMLEVLGYRVLVVPVNDEIDNAGGYQVDGRRGVYEGDENEEKEK